MTGKTFAAGSSISPAFRPPPDGENQRQVSRFLVIGFASVGVDFGCYQLLSWAGFPSPAAKGTSYLAGMLLGFLGNKFWTFRSARRSAAEPLSYILLYALTLLINVAAHTAVLRMTGPGGAATAFLFATSLTTVLNFAGMKWFAFRIGIQQRQTREHCGAAEAITR
jgi:putative flippase GtrA